MFPRSRLLRILISFLFVFLNITGVNDPVLTDSGTGKSLSVLNTAGWEDTVLWNPYGDEGMGYNNFVCVESVKFDPVTLEGGSSWVGDMALKPSSA